MKFVINLLKTQVSNHKQWLNYTVPQREWSQAMGKKIISNIFRCVCINKFWRPQSMSHQYSRHICSKKFKSLKGLTSVILVNLPPGLLKPPLSPALLWGNKWRYEGDFPFTATSMARAKWLDWGSNQNILTSRTATFT